MPNIKYQHIAQFYGDKLNLQIGEYIGGGANGEAFLTNKNTIIKITTSTAESNVVYKLIKNNNHRYNKHIADYYNIHKINYQGTIFFGIHMERLDTNCEIIDLWLHTTIASTQYNATHNDIIDYRKPNTLINLLNADSVYITPKVRWFIQELIEVSRELQKKDVYNDDLTGGNLGYKTGTKNLAVFDIADFKTVFYAKCDYIMENRKLLIKKYLMKNLHEDLIPGGVGDDKTAQDLAMKHSLFVGTIEKEIEIGTKIELEHTDDKNKAKEIAIDHITEFGDYYTGEHGLKKMEKQLKKDQTNENYQYNLKRLLRESLTSNDFDKYKVKVKSNGPETYIKYIMPVSIKDDFKKMVKESNYTIIFEKVHGNIYKADIKISAMY
jgi:hypothetical protein